MSHAEDQNTQWRQWSRVQLLYVRPYGLQGYSHCCMFLKNTMIRLDRSFKLNRAITNQSKEAITSAENKELLKCLRGQKSVST